MKLEKRRLKAVQFMKEYKVLFEIVQNRMHKVLNQVTAHTRQR